MEQNINISEILKDKPVGLKFYSNTFGYISFNGVHKDKVYFFSEDTNAHSVKPNGKMYDGGECIIFPSKEMRDWSKFFKKGDVLEYAGKDTQGTCIFVKYEDDTKMKFVGVYLKEKECIYTSHGTFRTVDFVKSDDPAGYIRFVEERLGGKLNRETLEIEKPQPEFKDGDIVVAEEDNYYDKVIFIAAIKDNIVSKALINVRYKDYEVHYNEYSFGCNRSLRLATDFEKQQLFDALAKEGKRWDSGKKQIVDLKPAFEIGKLYVFNEEDEDGELTIIGELIAKNESEDTLTFGNQYEIENEKFVTDQTFDLRISVNKELREATENEVELFNKHYDIWKNGKEQPAFKTFDKVLVRCGKGFKWLPAFFVRDRGEDFASRYNVLPLHSGKAADFTQCIPYEGHENFAFTDYDFVDLPF